MTSFGARLLPEAATTTLHTGEEFIVRIKLDTEGESINTFQGTLGYSSQLLEIKEILQGDSIINFWIDQPSPEGVGVISFSGITPGGYQGKDGTVFSILFNAKQMGKQNILIRDMVLLKNDGEATQVKVTTKPLALSITKQMRANPPTVSTIKENLTPEGFKPEIGRTSDLFENNYFIAFATQDKGSGIDHYEVKEGFFGSYAEATSPYVLKDQRLIAKVYVKAIDKDGNEKVQVVYPENWKPWYKNYLLVIGMILGILGLSYYLRKHNL